MKKILILLIGLSFLSCQKETVTETLHITPGCYANPGGFGEWHFDNNNTFRKVVEADTICKGLYSFSGDSLFLIGNQLNLFFKADLERYNTSGDTVRYKGRLEYSSGPGYDPWSIDFLKNSCK